jgi:hypothetical protein
MHFVPGYFKCQLAMRFFSSLQGGRLHDSILWSKDNNQIDLARIYYVET